MIRQVNLDEISDGRVYHLHDLVKADCNGCIDCSECCRSMGKTITLDPFDVYNLTSNLEKSFEELISRYLELNIYDGVIIPNLRTAATDGACLFLNNEGRCTVHGFRPGLCRLFPLGRFFDNNEVYYIVQIYECKQTNRSEVRVDDWIGLPDMVRYEKFTADWYYYQKKLKAHIYANADQAKAVNMYNLKTFYLTPYSNDDFFEQFAERLKTAEKYLFNSDLS